MIRRIAPALLLLLLAPLVGRVPPRRLLDQESVGQRLLDYGYIPALGTSLNWSLFVLSIHVVWSIATPILIAEGVAASRRTQPWLEAAGLAITALLFLGGSAITVAFTLKMSPFVATRSQFITVAVIVVLAMGAAFAFPPRRVDAHVSADRGAAPNAMFAARLVRVPPGAHEPGRAY